MKDRLAYLLKEKDLTPSKFAEQLGVQPSAISHLLSGRNNPSYELIRKLLVAFPDIDLRWLITGNQMSPITEGIIFDSDLHREEDLFSFDNDSLTEITDDFQPKGTVFPNVNAQKTAYKIDTQSVNAVSNSKDISKVVVFYTDGTYEELIK